MNSEFIQMSLPDILTSYNIYNENIDKNRYNDIYCSRGTNRCLLCKSMDKYVKLGKDFSYRSDNLEYYSEVNDYVYVEQGKNIYLDTKTASLLINQKYEQLLKQKKIDSYNTIGKTCANIFKKYRFGNRDIHTFVKIQEIRDLTRILKPTEIPIEFKDIKMATPLKSTTVQNIILGLVELFKICNDGNILVGSDISIDNIGFIMNKTMIKIGTRIMESRFRLVFELPILSSIKSSTKVISSYLPHQHHRLNKSYRDIITITDDIVTIVDDELFLCSHQTGVIDFKLGNSYTFLSVLLQYCLNYSFLVVIFSDQILSNLWTTIFGDYSEQVKGYILDGNKNIRNLITKIEFNKDLINVIITNIDTIFVE